MTQFFFIPLAPVPSQQVRVTLGTQDCILNVYQKTTGLFMDVLRSTGAVVSGVLCLDRERIIIDAYHGFAGDVAFVDTQGANDPDYTGLGTRYRLVWAI